MFTYHYLLTEGSIDHIKQDSFTLKVAAQKGDGLLFSGTKPSKYEVVDILHLVGSKTILRLNEVKHEQEENDIEQENIADLIKKAIAFGYEKGSEDTTCGTQVSVDESGEEYFNEFVSENELFV